MGERESCENVGEDGAVDLGELGLERFAFRPDSSWYSCECDLDIGCEMAYADSEGSRPVVFG